MPWHSNGPSKPSIQSYRGLKKPTRDSFGGTRKSHIPIKITNKSFVVALLCQAIFQWTKLYSPCMRATKVGMFTQEVFDKMSVRRMIYYIFISYQTYERVLNIVSNTPQNGFQRLFLDSRVNRREERESSKKKDEEKGIEDSTLLKIAESSA